jgi:4-amino-4-deoxy-L-arabinose transferase-like glycosyltransferase
MPDALDDGSRRGWVRAAVELLLIFAAGLFIYGYRLGDAPLDRTEPHRALVAHQMVSSGEWLIPRLFGEIYLRKPPLIYWIEGGTEKLIGHGGEFVWRLPSAIGSALLAVILAAWSARWFGAFARLPAGFACLALIPLWAQDRGADIDALNTLASVVTAMVIIEMVYRSPSPGTPGEGRGEGDFDRKERFDIPNHPSPLPAYRERESASSLWWIAALALTVAATLLLKGPGGFPPILGALIAPSLLLRNWKWVRRPGVWIGILVGIAIFASYGIVAKSVLRHEHIATDTGGLHEAMQRLVIHKVSAIGPALLAPLTTLLYAVPVSFALGFVLIFFKFSPRFPGGFPVLFSKGTTGLTQEMIAMRPAWPLEWKSRAIAIAGTIGAAFVIWILAGNDNPRYEYVALPLLAPLVGLIAVLWKDDLLPTKQQVVARAILAVFGGLWAGLAIILAVIIWKRADDHIGLVIAAGVGLIAGIVAVVCWLSARYRVAAAALVMVIVCLAVPLDERKNLERQKKSARGAAGQLRQIVHGEPVGTVSMNRDMPELFYYAHVPVIAYGERGLDKLAIAPGGRWVVLSQNPTFPEYTALLSQIPKAFPSGVTRLAMPDARELVYVGWYDPPPGVSRIVTPTPVAAEDVPDDE